MNIDELDILATQEEINLAMDNFCTKNEWKLLARYCAYRLIKVFGFNYNPNLGINGYTFEDLIQETNLAFCSVDRRNWNKSKFPCFRDQYYNTLDSVIYSAIKKYFEEYKKFENYKFHELQESILTEDHYNEFDFHWRRFQNLMNGLGGSQEELEIFDAYFIQGLKREEIAKIFNLSPQQITVIKKRLDRRLMEVSKKWSPS